MVEARYRESGGRRNFGKTRGTHETNALRAPLAVAVSSSLAALLVLAPEAVLADCTTTILGTGRPHQGDTIGIEAPGVPPEAVEGAVDLWQQCPEYGLDFPAFVTGRGEARTITVRCHPQSESTACATFVGNRIDLFSFAVDERGKRRPCGPRKLLLAHELGHVLGLADARGEGSCTRNIMSDIFKTNRSRRWVHEEECRAAGLRWLTQVEQQPAGGRSGAYPE
jgi:hypothetical protein